MNNDDLQIILEALKIEWQDFFEIRKQTWNTVIASGALIVGLLSAVPDKYIFVGEILLGVFSFFGLFVACHHRKCENEKMAYIRAFEELLKINVAGKEESLLVFLKNTTGSRMKYSEESKGSKKGLGMMSYSIMFYHVVVIVFAVVALWSKFVN